MSHLMINWWESIGQLLQFYILLIICCFAWTIVHETAHLIAAKLTCGVEKWKMKVWPCMLNGRVVGGFLQFYPTNLQTKNDKAIISLAPFMVSTVACVMLPVFVMSGSMLFSAIMMAGLLDQMDGSVVRADVFYDLPCASKNLDISLWIMRLCCLSIVFVSLVASTYAFIGMIK